MRTVIITASLVMLAATVSAQPCAGQREQHLVSCIKNVLDVQGQPWHTNEDAFEITRRVACIQPGAQLVGKTPAQNGAVYKGRKYSHDALAFPTGWKDILVDAGPPTNLNRPAWGDTAASAAPLFDPVDCDDVEPIPPPVVDLGPLLRRLDAVEFTDLQQQNQLTILAGQIEALTRELQQYKAAQDALTCSASVFGIGIPCRINRPSVP